MSAPNTRRQFRDRTARSELRSGVGEWTAAPRPQPVAVPNPPPSRGDRFAAWCWRLHDGMPVVWALLFAGALIVSGTATVLIATMAFGWQP